MTASIPIKSYLLILLFAAGSLPVHGLETADEIPRFEGYLSVNESIQFAFTARRSGEITSHALLRLGQSFVGYVLEDFDRSTEVLTVRDAVGNKHLLRLRTSKVEKADAESGRIAKKKALQQIDDYRRKAMERFGGTNVIVDLDGSLLPESRKNKYESHRLESEQKGRLFFPVSVDGRWLNIYVPIEGKNPDPKVLADLSSADGDLIRLLWKIAQAEAGARILAGPRVKDRGASADAANADKKVQPTKG